MQFCLGRAFLVFNAIQGVGVFAQSALAGEPSCLCSLRIATKALKTPSLASRTAFAA
jgi:hypothetical protein